MIALQDWEFLNPTLSKKNFWTGPQRTSSSPSQQLLLSSQHSSPAFPSPRRDILLNGQENFWYRMDPICWLHPPQLQNGSSSANSSLVASPSCCGPVPFSASWPMAFRCTSRRSLAKTMWVCSVNTHPWSPSGLAAGHSGVLPPKSPTLPALSREALHTHTHRVLLYLFES